MKFLTSIAMDIEKDSIYVFENRTNAKCLWKVTDIQPIRFNAENYMKIYLTDCETGGTHHRTVWSFSSVYYYTKEEALILAKKHKLTIKEHIL